MVRRAPDLERRQFSGCALPDEAILASQPPQIIVMNDDGNAVRRQMDITLDGIAALGRGGKGGKRVLPASLVHVMEAAMGDGPGDEPG